MSLQPGQHEQIPVRRRSERLECLESIRGLAAVAVVLHHITQFFYPVLYHFSPTALAPAPLATRIVAWPPFTLLYNGAFAVTLFFVLSGFVLSLSFFRRPNTAVLASGAVRRYFRLTIPILGSVMLAYILLRSGLIYSQRAAPFLPSDSSLHRFYRFPARLPDALNQGFTIVFGMRPVEESYNSVLWTMPREFAGSMLVFGFLALFGQSSRRAILYIATFLTVRQCGWDYLGNFIAGIIVCDLYVRCSQRGGQFCGPRWLRIAMLLLGIYLGARQYPGAAYPKFVLKAIRLLQVDWSTLGAVLIIAATVGSCRLNRVLALPAFQFLGRISFGLYLVHVPVLASLSAGVFYSVVKPEGTHYVTALWLAATTGLVGSLLLAWPFYWLVDRQSLRVGKMIDNAVFGGRR